MRQWLLKQRQKPKHVRDNIAFGFASGAAVVAFGAWAFMLMHSNAFKSDDFSVKEKPEAFSTLMDQIKEQVAGVRDSVKDSVATSTATSTAEGAPNFGSASVGPSSATTSPEAVLFVVPSASGTVSSTSLPETNVIY